MWRQSDGDRERRGVGEQLVLFLLPELSHAGGNISLDHAAAEETQARGRAGLCLIIQQVNRLRNRTRAEEDR